MRHTFSDGARIKAAAKTSVKTGAANLRRWWSTKYKLPANHHLFRDQTHAELNQEMLEDLLLRKGEILEELEEGEDEAKPQNRQEALLVQLRSINKALGEEEIVEQDDLVAHWNDQLDRGEDPDLDMTVDDLQQLNAEGKV